MTREELHKFIDSYNTNPGLAIQAKQAFDALDACAKYGVVLPMNLMTAISEATKVVDKRTGRVISLANHGVLWRWVSSDDEPY